MAKRILIVEDDIFIRDSLADLLQDEGFTVTTVENGALALESLSNLPLPDLIFLDLMMPIMDGFQFRDEMLKKQNFKDVKVVVMSADGNINEKKTRTMANAYLKKPLDIDILLETVESLLNN